MILHTDVSGEGEPVVFLHTGLQTGETELEIQKEYFNQDNLVILPDLRGHGKSVAEDFTDYFAQTAIDLSETMDDLKIQPAHIAGCSLGGLTALMFAKEYPEKTKSLTLSGIMAEKPSNWEELNRLDVENEEKMLEHRDTAAYFDRLHEGNWRELLRLTQEESWYPFDETADLSMLGMPVLYIVGEKNMHEVKGTITYPKMNPNIHVATIPFAGHAVHLDQPEIYNKMLETFISKVCR